MSSVSSPSKSLSILYEPDTTLHFLATMSDFDEPPTPSHMSTYDLSCGMTPQSHHTNFARSLLQFWCPLYHVRQAGPQSAVVSVGTSASSSTTSPSGTQLRMPPPTSGGINEPQECPYCHRTFSCYYSLKRHFQDKHEQSDTLYVCEFCHRRYRTKNSLTTHKSLQHRGSSGMLKRLLKTSAIKNVLGPHHGAPHPRPHLFDFAAELGQPPPGIQ
ncbi:broad-complex core protein-like [Phlebotomus argentipes]|uniref:broad-complex core protein-like n=1 Tax=Phlebotomus argentipes TaxID=94469 RepID=UPI002892A162|nr:broad-complex core protein-like [Phlebotomus argentipes]